MAAASDVSVVDAGAASLAEEELVAADAFASVVAAAVMAVETSEAKEAETLDRMLEASEAADAEATLSVAVAATSDTDESRDAERDAAILDMALLISEAAVVVSAVV